MSFNYMSKYPTKVITIEAVSDKPDRKKASIKGDDGNWYETFRDWRGEQKQAYAQLTFGNHNEAFRKGDVARISYSVGEYNGKPQYMLLSIFPAEAKSDSFSPEPPRSVANKGQYDEFSRRLGVRGHVNALLSNPNFKLGSDVSEIIRWVIQIEDEINKQLPQSDKP